VEGSGNKGKRRGVREFGRNPRYFRYWERGLLLSGNVGLDVVRYDDTIFGTNIVKIGGELRRRKGGADWELNYPKKGVKGYRILHDLSKLQRGLQFKEGTGGSSRQNLLWGRERENLAGWKTRQ